jgi:hypothetical protein
VYAPLAAVELELPWTRNCTRAPRPPACRHRGRRPAGRRGLRHTPTGVLSRGKRCRLFRHDRSGFHHGARAPRIRDSSPIAVLRLGRPRRADAHARRGSERPRRLPRAHPRPSHPSALQWAHSRLRSSLGAPRIRPSVGSSVGPSLRPPVGSSLRSSVEEPLRSTRSADSGFSGRARFRRRCCSGTGARGAACRPGTSDSGCRPRPCRTCRT